MERKVGGGIRMGNTCKPMAVSFQCMTKFTTNKKKKKELKVEGNTNVESRKVVINTNYDHVTSLKKSRTVSVMNISILLCLCVYIHILSKKKKECPAV